MRRHETGSSGTALVLSLPWASCLWQPQPHQSHMHSLLHLLLRWVCLCVPIKPEAGLPQLVRPISDCTDLGWETVGIGISFKRVWTRIPSDRSGTCDLWHLGTQESHSLVYHRKQSKKNGGKFRDELFCWKRTWGCSEERVKKYNEITLVKLLNYKSMG